MPSMPPIKEEQGRALTRLVASWRERRAMLARQLEMLESGDMHSGTSALDTTTRQDIARLRSWIAELDALIAEHAT
jgi:hypothetical protein